MLPRRDIAGVGAAGTGASPHMPPTGVADVGVGASAGARRAGDMAGEVDFRPARKKSPLVSGLPGDQRVWRLFGVCVRGEPRPPGVALLGLAQLNADPASRNGSGPGA